ncbi:AbrB/MazE/SpoVT family DNA-binding domain-containing protein [Lacticaseibacillus zhaodongensis]|uniref:AbrB/MazE/SpoVT family DNA-binding domain-containing protein n=1 Tax=Lacticaseibacillus zhaodongensis TaxID=2668065 RepID=UPI0018AF9B38|nr:AbrB/MazE/SpoVT family DNA-binding domain-containing protein [Lacticaseibacillus zhaodongensis]
MTSVTRKIGKSNQSLITVIPKEYAAKLKLSVGDEVEVTLDGDAIKLTKKQKNGATDFEEAMHQAEQLYTEFEPLMDYLQDK